MKTFPAILLLLIIATGTSQAMILWNLDNSANQTNPGTGVPFGSVAAVTNSVGTLRSGSAVYLGDGFLLTANHVTMDATFSHVTFNGTDSFEIDASFKSGSRLAGKQVTTTNPGQVLDMAVFKLKIAPVGIPAVSLLTTNSELVAPATLIGWGVGRDPAVPLESAVVNWGNATTSAKRWGVSTIRAATVFPYGGYSFNSLVTVAGGTGPSFSPDGLGNSEASPSLLDSGSGLFQQIGGNWFLVGLTATVEQQSGGSTTTFGNDSTSGAGRGDLAFYSRISDYDADILALIPEPSTASLLLAAMLLGFLRIRETKRRCRERTKSLCHGGV